MANRRSKAGAMALLTAMNALAGAVYCIKCGARSESMLTSIDEGWAPTEAGLLCQACAEEDSTDTTPPAELTEETDGS